MPKSAALVQIEKNATDLRTKMRFVDYEKVRQELVDIKNNKMLSPND